MSTGAAVPTPAIEAPSEYVITEGLEKLTKDLKHAAATLTKTEARFLVDSYYQMQDSRIRTGGQIREMLEANEPHVVLGWFNRQADGLEDEIQKALDAYSNNFVLGRWARSQYGIGPVIAAGLLAHIDIEKAKTAGAIWKFAGLDPTTTWGKGQKRPWNADLKVLCWKIGDSFLKQSGRPNDVYGHVLMQRKEYETAMNEQFAYRDQAAAILKAVPNHKQASIYKTGKLPPGQILSRAKRYATKLFLAHYHHVAFELKYKTAPPKPYILTQPGHVHFLAPPNWPMVLKKKLPKGIKDLP
jgi:hypothetical protein